MGARGEAKIELRDDNGEITETVVVLFTNRALAEAEQATGKSVMQLLSAAVRSDMSVCDIAQLLAVGMEAARREARTGSRALTLNDAYRVMDHVGWKRVASAILPALTAVFAYDQEEEHPPSVPA